MVLIRLPNLILKSRIIVELRLLRDIIEVPSLTFCGFLHVKFIKKIRAALLA